MKKVLLVFVIVSVSGLYAQLAEETPKQYIFAKRLQD